MAAKYKKKIKKCYKEKHAKPTKIFLRKKTERVDMLTKDTGSYIIYIQSI